MVASVLLLIPLGLLMGMPFPLGIRLVDRVNPGLVAWAWGVNGFSSVVGSILAVMIAQSYGFSVVIGLAVVVYLLGLVVIRMVDGRQLIKFASRDNMMALGARARGAAAIARARVTVPMAPRQVRCSAECAFGQR